MEIITTKPAGYDAFMAEHPRLFESDPDAAEVYKWRYVDRILVLKKQKENMAYMTKQDREYR